jgi:3',5'-cyclic AMP phosphodiesterase CpdA
MTTLLQVSDPHFGTERPPVVDALMRLALREKPDVLLLSGDITQRARRSQFEAAHAFVQQTRIKTVLAIPGNHDIPLYNLWARIAHPYRGYTRCFGGELEPSHESADLLLLCVNTTRPWRHKHGEVSPEQIERVAARLRAARPEQLRIVVTHQPVHVIRESDEKNLLRGHRDAIAGWARAGADLVLGGHIHLAHVRPLAERVAGAAGWSVQAGTAVSHRVRHGRANSVNLLRWDGGRCGVERWDHDAQRGEFVCAEMLPLALMRPSIATP